MIRRWLFADQLGPHFLDAPRQPVLLVESKAVFRRRAYHRQKAHLVLSALRHRAAELGEQALFLHTETYGDALLKVSGEPIEVCHPTSRGALAFVSGRDGVTVLPPRGFATTPADFVAWADRRHGRLRLEDFYRDARRRHGVLMDGGLPAGGRWNLADDPAPDEAPTAVPVPPPVPPVEDDIDAEVRADLDRWEAEGIRFVGRDGPRRFPVTRAEALARLRHFVDERLPALGRPVDEVRAHGPVARSLLSPAFNLGLLEPLEAVRRAEAAYRAGAAPLSSVEGFVRQLLGWRDYIWHLYWYFGADRGAGGGLRATRSVPPWFATLDAAAVEARCLSDVLAGVRDHGWAGHIPRLLVLGNYGLQRGWRPAELADWFRRVLVDGHEWALTANVVGLSPLADLGTPESRPYVAGGGYLNRIGDYCRGCRYDPRSRLGVNACPFSAGYWSFLDRNRGRLPANARLDRAMQQLDRFDDLNEVRAQERSRGDQAP